MDEWFYGQRHGLWSVLANGARLDSMRGYGYAWALMRSDDYIGRDWVHTLQVEYVDPDTGEKRVLTRKSPGDQYI